MAMPSRLILNRSNRRTLSRLTFNRLMLSRRMLSRHTLRHKPPTVTPKSAPNVYAYASGPRPGYGYAATTQGPYQLDSGDRLRIVAFGQDGLTNSYAVDASGHIAMPLIGSVSARGLTTDQLGHAIADKQPR